MILRKIRRWQHRKSFWNCCTIKTLKQLLENTRHTINELWNKYFFNMDWKYSSEMTNQTKNNDLNYLIDPTFTKFNWLFFLSFENENNRTSFSKYYVPNVQIKYFNVLIDRKSFCCYCYYYYKQFLYRISISIYCILL